MHLADKFVEVRGHSETLCAPLEIEDYQGQPIDFVSPPKWHLAHSTWFYEEFILNPFAPNYQRFDAKFTLLFNSYYNHMGEMHPRPKRGNLTRPTVERVLAYRKHVTEAMAHFLKTGSDEIKRLTLLGINHEQQHQELLAYDIKYILGTQPLQPAYGQAFELEDILDPFEWVKVPEGVYQVGHDGTGFCYDNELYRHNVYLHEYEIANRLVTNGEYIEFIEAKGYSNFDYFLSNGWDYINTHTLKAPLYWAQEGNTWYTYSFRGKEPVDENKPVMHLSYYEAAAYAQFRNARLPREDEWEIASDQFKFGQLWEWTLSAYLPYPNYQKENGALGEYNAKFMSGQKVLKGGSVATSPGHCRKTYRNYFEPNMRWMFSGLRLAR
ncbi:MAG: Hercynine oxygenase [Chlamydiia bacterium]|nr:Hercynine oxygenase [Chlamydiia bacterium]MCH9616582.1 Hercynine oxygenase [Chlamydiia bacterium]